mmetsp:Transcript_7916/g.11421  ORF Transcript_7916/g.11421 Transcript_7916/m.11421 type:complete len:410 (+) Transcript_7916:75-1304(+)
MRQRQQHQVLLIIIRAVFGNFWKLFTLTLGVVTTKTVLLVAVLPGTTTIMMKGLVSTVSAAASSVGGEASSSLSQQQRRFVTSSQTATKQLWIIRHGQATHNPRAEKAKEEGCSHDEFMELMRQDDSLDAELTDWGQMQAKQLSESLRQCTTSSDIFHKVQLIVSSPLSRAIHTADLVLPRNAAAIADSSSSSLLGGVNQLDHHTSSNRHRRVCVEHFREINGWLLNAQRRNKTDLCQRFPLWEMTELQHHDDVLWQPHKLEDTQDCAQRGYEGLCWLTERPEHNIALVSHGGILRFTMNDHPYVRVVDGRRGKRPGGLPASSCSSISDEDNVTDENSNEKRSVHARFDNCEMRHYLLSWTTDSQNRIGNNDHSDTTEQSGSDASAIETFSFGKKIITLTEIYPGQTME